MESWVNFSEKEGHTDIQPSTRPGIEPGTFRLEGRDLPTASTLRCMNIPLPNNLRPIRAQLKGSKKLNTEMLEGSLPGTNHTILLRGCPACYHSCFVWPTQHMAAILNFSSVVSSSTHGTDTVITISSSELTTLKVQSPAQRPQRSAIGYADCSVNQEATQEDAGHFESHAERSICGMQQNVSSQRKWYHTTFAARRHRKWPNLVIFAALGVDATRRKKLVPSFKNEVILNVLVNDECSSNLKPLLAPVRRWNRPSEAFQGYTVKWKEPLRPQNPKRPQFPWGPFWPAWGHSDQREPKRHQWGPLWPYYFPKLLQGGAILTTH